MLSIIITTLIFASMSVECKFSLEWEDLRVVDGSKLIFNAENGSALSGRVLGILGPSGSGKTSLLRSLSERTTAPLQASGSVHYKSGADGMQRRFLPEEIAFIHQEDFFFGMLTVRETLNFAQSFHSTYTARPQVDDVIRQIGLEKVSDSFIGDSTTASGSQWTLPFLPFSKKNTSGKLSGGERKRLAIGSEMFGNPQLLILDEPTSGLDSFSAERMIQLVRDLTRYSRVRVRVRKL